MHVRLRQVAWEIDLIAHDRGLLDERNEPPGYARPAAPVTVDRARERLPIRWWPWHANQRRGETNA